MKRLRLSIGSLLSALIYTIGSAQAQQAVTIPAGTAMRVRTLDSLDMNSASPDVKIRGSLADPLVSRNGAVLLHRGTPVQLSVVSASSSSRLKGRDRISLKVDSVMFNGRSLPVVTTVSESQSSGKGARTLRRVGIGAGAGTVIGAIAGGGTGAAVGALVGGGGGTAVAAATGKNRLKIPAETVLSFQLNSPLTLR